MEKFTIEEQAFKSLKGTYLLSKRVNEHQYTTLTMSMEEIEELKDMLIKFIQDTRLKRKK